MCEGYEKLKAAVEKDCNDRNSCKCFNPDGCNITSQTIGTYGSDDYKRCFHSYCDQFKWVIDRAKQYGEKLGLNWEDILDSWEEKRNYWYMNYYQDCEQPEIKGDRVRVFETSDNLRDAIGHDGFRCPSCGGISKNPYTCDSGIKKSGKVCDWKVYGLFGDLGKGIFVYIKEKLSGQNIFMPIAWEKTIQED